MPEEIRFVVMGLHGMGWALVHTLWIGCAIWLVVRIALAVLPGRAARARYTLCYAGLGLLAVLPFGLGIVIEAEYADHTTWVRQIAGDVLAHADAPDARPPGAFGTAVPPDLRAAIVARHDGMYSPLLSDAAARWLGMSLALTALLWLAIVATRIARVVGGVSLLAHFHAIGTQRPGRRWRSALVAARSRMGIRRPIALHASARVGVPVVYGVLRPVVLVPADRQARLSPGETRAILAHELAHVARWDGPMTVLQALADAVLFFHPVARWLSGRVSEERECCADDLACRANGITPACYGRALLKLESVRPPIGVPVLAATGRDTSLVTRMRRLTDLDGDRWPMSRCFIVVALVATVLTVAADVAWSALVPASEQVVMQHDLQRLDYLTLPASR